MSVKQNITWTDRHQ